MASFSLKDELFGETSKPTAKIYEKYGFDRNPFPGNEEEFFDFVHGQDEAKQVFMARFEQFQANRTVNTLLISADHRIGKTNFLRHYHHRLEKRLHRTLGIEVGDFLLPFYTRAYEYDFFFIYQQIVENFPESVFVRLFESLEKEPLSDDITDTDLTRALKQFNNRGFGIREHKIDLFRRWLKGGYRSLGKSDMGRLGVRETINNSPVGCRFLRDLLDILRERRIIDGLMMFFDEFERLAGAGLSRSQKDRYLNDIRNFISDFQKGAFFLFAITPGGLQVLQKDNPAIPPRLGTELSLRHLESEEDALGFARKYINHFRTSKKTKEILTEDQISVAYFKEKERFGGVVHQGNFLARLREEAEKKAFDQQ